MKNITRRQWIGKSTLGIGSAMLTSRTVTDLSAMAPSKTVPMPLGFQVWTLKDNLVKDFPGTLKKMAALGYRSVEMCSPPGYLSSGFGPLIPMKAKEMKQIINDAGLLFESTHYDMDELKANLEERIQFALDSGQKQMIASSFSLPEKATMSDWLKAADELNQMGVKAKKAGMILGFHNHHMEFETLDGKLIYDALMERLDPDLIKMQFQVAVISVGFKASTYFRKYPGRFISAHLADWSAKGKKEATIGQGIVDWKEFFSTIKIGGVKNIFVEMSPNTFQDSAKYINSL